ncbi:MAG: hypothetical protein DDT34_01407 [Firmicutes bacterium]|nr:hypothetical protein [Bacillota bacterium]
MPNQSTKIEYANVDHLNLDPSNPRLGRRVAAANLGQPEVLDIMKDWSPEELATSFLESGFWPQEALIAVTEDIYGQEGLVVVEGNRRLAAIKLLKLAIDGSPTSAKWRDIAASGELSPQFFGEIPYILVDNRSKVSAYLGYRHVTGIKEWKPAEKAEYIAKLIEEEGLTYDEVRRKIGSKTPSVKQHYIAYRLLLQMDEQEEINTELVEEKFSVLYLSLRTAGVKKYLELNLDTTPENARTPVPAAALPKMVNYSRWLFGTDKDAPLFTDSRYVDDFGKVLESPDAVEYLERNEKPRFEVALRKSGAAETHIVDYVLRASDNIQLALAEAHVFRKSEELTKAVSRFGADAMQLISVFPSVRKAIVRELSEDAGTS